MKKILVVEDDKKIALALAVRLRAEGFEVFLAHDGLMGVQQAVKVKPDLVLLDISMPAGNGFTVAERIQAIPNLMGTPMIFMTASRKLGLDERAREAGAVGFFEKPYDADELMRAIGEALGTVSPNRVEP